MKKIFLSLFLYFVSVANISAETVRIISGNKDAKITIIAYESLTCSHCADFHKNIYPQLKKDYIDTGIVKLEFRHFPLDMAALNASKISQCTQDQGLEILDSLYSNQKDWIKGNTVEDLNSNLKKFIQNKGFNLDIDNCLSNKEIEDFVLNDRIEGTKNFEINSTPTVIINNEKFKKTLNYKNLKKSIEKLI